MPTAAQWKKALQSGVCDEALCRLYVTDDPLPQRERCLRLLEQFTRLYGEREEVRIFSAPGWAATTPTTSTAGCWLLLLRWTSWPSYLRKRRGRWR